MNTRTQACRLN